MPNLTFPKNHHLRKDADFQRVYAARVYAADDVLVVNGCENGLAHPRLGLSVSREAFRLVREMLPVGVDFVVRPQKEAVFDFQAISQSLPELAARIARKLARSRA
jgi:ribonuclease P protein component